MVIVLKPGTPEKEILKLREKLECLGLTIHNWQDKSHCVLVLSGDITKVNLGQIEANEYVEKVMRVQEPFKASNRLFHPQDTIIEVAGRRIGEGYFAVAAGPCSVECEEQIVDIARRVKESGAAFLRGGAFKPRTSPYSFQGLGLEGLELLKIAKKETGLPIVTELMSPKWIDKFVEDVDIIQIGARNVQNFELLKEVGKTKKPVLLKRGMSTTIEEFLMSAEYIMVEGNENVILCERGIRTFEKYTRNTLDLSAVPAIKKLSHLPVVVDPSHGAGLWWMVEPLSKAAVAVGADGLLIEVHNDPVNALTDGQQSIKPDKFHILMNSITQIVKIEGKIMQGGK